MRKAFVAFGVALGTAVVAQQQANPRQQPGAMVTLFGIRDRKTLRVAYPMANKRLAAGEVNPATQQIDFYIRSPKADQRNRPAREVFMHFFGVEVAWK